MSRIELGGVGTPVIEVALPAPGALGDLPPQLFNLVDGAAFEKAVFVDLGYTHFEAICVGAAGGRGGFYIALDGGSPYFRYDRSYGGGGGGGGLHKVTGLLADLPDSSPVVVGQAGVQGSFGCRYPTGTGGFVHVPAGPGGDGGASSFNSELCQASGGKGGMATAMAHAEPGGPVDHLKFPGGNGGEGGCGNRAIAGGGGAGSSSEANGVDGGWDGLVGKGGGGGRGGSMVPDLDGNASSIYLAEGTSGGRGSLDVTDTSVYGLRELRSYEDLNDIQPPYYASSINTNGAPYGGAGRGVQQIRPGGGGGAKVRGIGAGSFVTGYTPNGLVLLRVYTLA